MGLFNPFAPFLADVNLLLQSAILFILVASVGFKFRRDYMKHGVTMGLAIVLHTLSIFLVMVPSLMASSRLFADLLNRLPFMMLMHAVLGSLVEVLGVYLLAVWIANRGVSKACFKNRLIMRATIVLWVVELILGVYVYVLLYVRG